MRFGAIVGLAVFLAAHDAAAATAPADEGEALSPILDLKENVPEPRLVGTLLTKAGDQALYDRLRGALQIETRANPAAAAAIDDALRRLVQSPTARILAAELLKEGAKVRVSFEAGECRISDRNGKKIIVNSDAQTETRSSPIHVKLCREMLRADPEVLAAHMTEALPHELLGHALETLRARKRGLSLPYSYYFDNEANATLVGWTVNLELGGVPNGWIWPYLRDPKSYFSGLELALPFYAGTFHPDQMGAPVRVLEERLKRIPGERARLETRGERDRRWRGIIDHFVTVHGASRDAFHSLLETYDYSDQVYIPRRREVLGRIQSYLQNRLDYYSTIEGVREISGLQAARGDYFFVEEQARIQRRADRLRELLQGKRRPTGDAVVPAGQFSQDQLAAMYHQDRREHPEHWPAVPRP